jgi:hypothetical protein
MAYLRDLGRISCAYGEGAAADLLTLAGAWVGA